MHVRRRDKYYTSVPEAVLTENQFYTIKLDGGGASLIVENSLAELEGKYADIYRRKLVDGILLTPEERAVVAVFIAAMMLRTKSQRANLQRFFDEIRDFSEKLAANPPTHSPPMETSGKGIPVEEFLAHGDDMDTYHSMFLATNIEWLANLIYSMQWGFMTTTPDEPFITCDDPVSWVNEDFIKEHGHSGPRHFQMLADKGAELSMPLSSTLTWLGGWKIRVDGTRVPMSKENVAAMNNRTVLSAMDELVAADRASLEKIHYRGNGTGEDGEGFETQVE